MNPRHLTPMIHKHGQDFYTFEPAMLRDHRVCIPHRWFTRNQEIYARVWPMEQLDESNSWIVCEDQETEVNSNQLLLSFPSLIELHEEHGVADPRHITGLYHLIFKADVIEICCVCYLGVRYQALAQQRQSDSSDSDTEMHFASEEPAFANGIGPWKWSNPALGNKWRHLSDKHEVRAFPIWLYCDDTSGNLSKKWNKHNSFLFTPAGLSHHHVHRESNIHKELFNLFWSKTPI
jgi:hypothetical protein